MKTESSSINKTSDGQGQTEEETEEASSKLPKWPSISPTSSSRNEIEDITVLETPETSTANPRLESNQNNGNLDSNNNNNDPNPSANNNNNNIPDPGSESDDDWELSIEDHASVVMAILQPVSITMLIVVWVVQVINLPQAGGNVMSWYTVYRESSSDSNGTKLLGSILNALIFVAAITVVTVIFVLLYKYRCLKVIYAWLIGSTGMLLGLFGALLLYFILIGYGIAMDWITFSFVIWNFSIGGLTSIFWYGPTRLNQAYLIIISVLLAVFFTKLPEWTTWAILAAVAIYDIFAVLCPRGPLKVLVETAQERQEPIPALLYSGTVWFLGTDEEEGAVDPLVKKPRKSVKLGLGDFVFYSVLVGRAALFDIITVFTCFLGIITGLFFTLLLLGIFRKALPALPISIAIGLAFFFLTKVFLLPFILTLGMNMVLV